MTKKEYIKALREYLKKYPEYRKRISDLSARVSRAVVRCEADYLLSEIQEVSGEIKKILAVIRVAESSREKQILELRYIDGRSWEEVARRMNYSYYYCVHIEDAAVKKLVAKDCVRKSLDDFKKKCRG